VTSLSAAIAAQTQTEVRMRLRAPATLAAVLGFFAAAILWVPDPSGRATSLSWTLPDGRVQSPEYTAEAIGVSISILGCAFGGLVGFYFVAGSVRRDRESGVGAILAATPLTKTAYLAGKFASHLAYLTVIVLLAEAAGLVAFVRFGVGSFSLLGYFGPTLLLVVPGTAFVAAAALFFDVAPGLSGRGGLVIWFFVFLFGVIALPMLLSGGEKEGKPEGLPVLDPSGLATHQWLVRASVPDAKAMASGYVVRDRPAERVPWKPAPFGPLVVAARCASLLWALLPLAAAILLFDRFDPARRRLARARSGIVSRVAARFRRSETAVAAVEGATRPVSRTPVSARPTRLRAIVAEARLMWDSATWLKWPLALSSLLSGLLPGEASRGAMAAFFALLVPAISEASAREMLSGTQGLVFSQPGVPRSPALWKAASVAVFILVLASPAVLRALAAGPARGGAFLAGLLFVAGASSGLGHLTRGGKLFSGAFLALWYVAINGAPFADFAGAFAPAGPTTASLVYLGIGAACVAAARARERLATQ
jgi:ABC-type transport system involved in multi-copper enzyme maturation permease subunit